LITILTAVKLKLESVPPATTLPPADTTKSPFTFTDTDPEYVNVAVAATLNDVYVIDPGPNVQVAPAPSVSAPPTTRVEQSVRRRRHPRTGAAEPSRLERQKEGSLVRIVSITASPPI
jgi:hypothetical protein